ncbi:conserved hypothetical protein [Leishmania major strain Friedlin]|uniref:Uncharacterized protein n=1 Tax=Leishmania major TaxID=5664 RepID=Q4Q961_LEIMA|nr:conserved hypothetical protein [Leishmania major strain Friedlin]CAG9576454.1 hypothetical_protein_-_conserved [Leishmania major strain Friedlin]CAJ05220.1 conserved hypothetical protein [Leishmania major strain Friedlin]|eukprot:XP_001684137.1 conserved hypothetical protein [Leishmania major strain Friedlin]
MIVRTAARLSARWPAALLAASRGLPSSGAWMPRWSAFFNELQLQEESHRGGTDKASNTRFDAVPAPLLRSIAQHWVDEALLEVASARLAEVYPPAHANGLKGVCEAAVTPSEGLESLLATWSAHMLLSVLHAPRQASIAAPLHKVQSCAYAAPDTVSAVLADCLGKDIAPVLRYLTAFATPPVSKPTSHQSHHLAASTRVLRHALVLLLYSFVTTWRGAPPRETPPPPGAIALTREERALALELCRCVAALNESDTGSESIATGERRGDTSAQAHSRDARAEATGSHVTSLEAVTGAQFALVRDALADMLAPDHHSDGSAASTPVRARDSVAGNGPLWRACEAWIAGAVGTAVGASVAPPSSPFAGITGVRMKEEEAVDLLERVNDQLNQIARGGAVNAASRQCGNSAAMP